MKRDPRLVPLSSEHHQALVLCLRIDRELGDASDEAVEALYRDALHLWTAGLIPHFGAEADCLLARLVRHVSPQHEGVARIQSDHLRVSAIMANLRDSETGDPRRAALRDLAATLREHVRWEEATFFPLVEAELTGAELDNVAADLLDRLPREPPTAYGDRAFPPR